MPLPLQCFERKRFPVEAGLQDSRDEEKLQKEDKKLLCRLCGEFITSHSNRVNVNDAHIHTRQNPAGLTFTFACFDAAPGCRVWGKATQEHTWFGGHFWQIAVCAGCGEHLGWSFKNSGRFYGLIIDRLTEGDK